MTKATVLADALVEAGILDYVGNHREMSRPGYTELGRFYWVKGDEAMEDEALDHDGIITDWRVAGKVLESMDGEILIWLQKYSKMTDVWIVETEQQDADARNESLPRAIIEAWYEATR